METEVGRIPQGAQNQLVSVVGQVVTSVDVERWINVTFEVDDDDPNAGFDSPLFGYLAARGPSNPLVTVMSPSPGGKKPRLTQVGIRHKAGQQSASQLVDAGIELPEGWRVVQDHPRRGLVVDVRDDEPVDVVVNWIVHAMDELNRAPTTGAILYELFESR